MFFYAISFSLVFDMKNFILIITDLGEATFCIDKTANLL